VRTAIKYDPVHDKSSLFERVAELKLSDRVDVDSTLYVSIDGKEKHPASWDCDLTVTVYGPKDCPDILGKLPILGKIPERPKLVIPYSVGVQDPDFPGMTIEGLMSRYPQPASDYHDESAYFKMSIDDLARLADMGRFTLNGKSIVLSDPEREVIRNAIVAAREVTNAGR
jgi:hypothetical protein